MKAALVLGASTKKILFKNKVKKALSLYKKGVVKKIIFSGRWWGGLKYKPNITEARSMANYAISLGLSKHHVFLQERSLNTIGNLYFSKKYFLVPNGIFDLIIITNKDHVKKVKYLTKKILGLRYSVRYFLVDQKHIYNKSSSLPSTKRFFSDIDNGDDKKVLELLKNHVYYKRYRKF